MQQNGVYDLLKMLEISLEEGFPIIPRKYTIVKTKEFETLIDRIYGSLPIEVQEARAFLKRREEMQVEAQQKAEKIIADAQKEAEQKLSDSNYLKSVERERDRIIIQVQEECKEMKRQVAEEIEIARKRAFEEIEASRSQVRKETLDTRKGAELYAEQVLNNLESNLNQLQQVVKNGQIYMEKLRVETDNKARSTSYETPTK